MVSNTGKTRTRREIRAKTAGRRSRIVKSKEGTPAFPIHPPGYDPKAPDARAAPESK